MELKLKTCVSNKQSTKQATNKFNFSIVAVKAKNIDVN